MNPRPSDIFLHVLKSSPTATNSWVSYRMRRTTSRLPTDMGILEPPSRGQADVPARYFSSKGAIPSSSQAYSPFMIVFDRRETMVSLLCLGTLPARDKGGYRRSAIS